VVPCGYLKYLTDNSVTKVVTSKKIKEEVIAAVKEMEEIVINEKIPGPTPYKKRCVNCFHLSHCRRV
jgi:CRISPR/Cas system-associated exonuclease Cas4 (RecB family)